MRCFFALIGVMMAALIGYPAMAQGELANSIEGVFEGTIGRYPIVACFDERRDGDGFGSYYYLSQLKPIPLAANDTKARWSEGSVFSFAADGSAPVWDVRRSGPDTITGTWHGAKRNYPLKLTRIADGAEEYGMACGSANYLGPRVGKPNYTRTPTNVGGFDYTILAFDTPAHFEEVSISGFTFETSQPGDSAIIAKLAVMLPSGSTQDEYIQCMAGNLAWLGIDGDFSQAIVPRFANDQLLSFETVNGSYCGGAHPNYGQGYFLYDRQSGLEINPFRWFNQSGLKQSEYDAKLMQEPLRVAIMEHWPDDAEPDCLSHVKDEEFWRFQLLAGGVSFQPDIAHVLTPCEEQVFLSWDEIGPFLSAEGRSIRKRAEQ